MYSLNKVMFTIYLILFIYVLIIKCNRLFIKDINQLSLKEGIQINLNHTTKISALNSLDQSSVTSALSIDFNNDNKQDLIICYPYASIDDKRINAGICYLILNPLASNHPLETINLNDQLEDSFELGFRILGI